MSDSETDATEWDSSVKKGSMLMFVGIALFMIYAILNFLFNESFVVTTFLIMSYIFMVASMFAIVISGIKKVEQ